MSKKYLTAEVVEYAEVETAKSKDRESRGKSGIFSALPRKIKITNGFSRKDLCALCLLSDQPLVFISGGSEEKREGKEDSRLIK